MPTRILLSDCRHTLRTLPDGSVHCIVTSPPYFGLRDYGCDGQIGLEPTPAEFMVAVYREARRVLRKDGSCWINLGDSYAAERKWGGRSGCFDELGGVNGEGRSTFPRHKRAPSGLKLKDRLMIPARVAIALQDDDWWLRDEIVWTKPIPMPSSVRDRTTPAHDMVYQRTRSARYRYDADAIREEAIGQTEHDLAGGRHALVGQHPRTAHAGSARSHG